MKQQEQSPKQAAAGVAVMGVLMIVGSVCLAWFGRQAIENYFAGPVEIQIDELVALAHPHQLPNTWVKFKPSEAVETGLRLTSGRVSQTAKAQFVLLKVNDSHIVAKVPLGRVRTPVNGHLTVWSAALSPEVEAMMEIRQKYPKANLLPFQLDAESPTAQSGAIFVVMVMLGGFGVIMVLVAWLLFTAKEQPKAAVQAVADPFSHPVWQLNKPRPHQSGRSSIPTEETPRPIEPRPKPVVTPWKATADQPTSSHPAGPGPEWTVFPAKSEWPLGLGILVVAAVAGWIALELGLGTRLPRLLNVTPDTARLVAWIIVGLTVLGGGLLAWESYQSLRWVAVSRDGIKWCRENREHFRGWDDFAGVQRIATRVLVNGQHTGTNHHAEVRFRHGDPLIITPVLLRDYEGLISAIEYHSHGRTGGTSSPWRLSR